jgi:hypothetical protein
MALQKEIKSKSGVTGNYMAVHAVSYNNENKSAAYSVALYLSKEAKRAGAEPIEIVYQGHTGPAAPTDMLAQCYADMKAKADKMTTVKVDGEEKEIPEYPNEHALFFGAEDV